MYMAGANGALVPLKCTREMHIYGEIMGPHNAMQTGIMDNVHKSCKHHGVQEIWYQLLAGKIIPIQPSVILYCLSITDLCWSWIPSQAAQSMRPPHPRQDARPSQAAQSHTMGKLEIPNCKEPEDLEETHTNRGGI